MTTSTLIRVVANNLGLKIITVDKVIKTFFLLMKQQAIKGKTMYFRGLGFWHLFQFGPKVSNIPSIKGVYHTCNLVFRGSARFQREFKKVPQSMHIQNLIRYDKMRRSDRRRYSF